MEEKNYMKVFLVILATSTPAPPETLLPSSIPMFLWGANWAPIAGLCIFCLHQKHILKQFLIKQTVKCFMELSLVHFSTISAFMCMNKTIQNCVVSDLFVKTFGKIWTVIQVCANAAVMRAREVFKSKKDQSNRVGLSDSRGVFIDKDITK